MNPEAGKRLGEAMKEVIQNQLRDGEPPETGSTYERLLDSGIERDEAIRMLAHCLTITMHDMMKSQTPWDRERFCRMLELLPDEDGIYDI